MSGILKYFKKEESTQLPDPEGPLSIKIPSSSIVSANKHVEPLLRATTEESCKRGQYDSFSEEEKAKIAKSACEIGVTNTIRKLSKYYPDKMLKRVQCVPG